MDAHAYKYTDRDVRENPQLTLMVKKYLGVYHGDFQFLIDAKHALAVQGELSAGVIRGVLNCMRTDPRCAAWTLPTPTQMPTVYLPPPGLYLVNTARPYKIKLNATFKYPYLMSLWKTAYLVHLLDPRKSVLWYITRTSTFETELASWCCLSWTHKRNLIMSTEIPEGRVVCRRCQANQEVYS